MTRYTPPLRDFRFLLTDVFGLQDLNALPGCEDINEETVMAIAETFGGFASERLAPLNAIADKGCGFDKGGVRTPPGYADAWRSFCADGWNGLACSEEWGGQGLPHVAHHTMREMLVSGCIAFSLFHELNYGVIKAVGKHGADWMKARILPHLVSGHWAGTMCLTEPHAGSDLGLIRTKAVRRPDGTFAITGNKIFITCGEHDLTENIIHLVLARIEGAPAGVGGISLFLVPKFTLLDGDAPGALNGTVCQGIEEKMGLHGSPTCSMGFDSAVGWLVGEENRGLGHMFTMMNAARLSVGVQGVAIGERALQAAEAYAVQRLQGRTTGAAKTAGAEAIIGHPDVRRELMSMRAQVEGGRALAWWISQELDVAARHPDPARRRKAEGFLALATPIFKSALSDWGFEVANRAVMIHGGHGYIKEMGIEQLVRDVRIAAIYEGTNGIQARDLVMRKITVDDGASVKALFREIREYLDNRLLPDMDDTVLKALGRLEEVTEALRRLAEADPDAVLAGASDYLSQFAIVLVGYLWCRMARVAADGDEPFLARKIDTAGFYMTRILPRAEAFGLAALAGRIPALAEELLPQP